MISVGNGNDAAFTTVLLMAMLIMLNIATLLVSIYIFTGQKINILFGSKVIIVVEYVVLFFIFYLQFARKGKHLEIIENYKEQSEREEMKGKFFAISYFILSVALMIFCFYLMIKKNRGGA